MYSAYSVASLLILTMIQLFNLKQGKSHVQIKCYWLLSDLNGFHWGIKTSLTHFYTTLHQSWKHLILWLPPYVSFDVYYKSLTRPQPVRLHVINCCNFVVFTASLSFNFLTSFSTIRHKHKEKTPSLILIFVTCRLIKKQSAHPGVFTGCGSIKTWHEALTSVQREFIFLLPFSEQPSDLLFVSQWSCVFNSEIISSVCLWYWFLSIMLHLLEFHFSSIASSMFPRHPLIVWLHCEFPISQRFLMF